MIRSVTVAFTGLVTLPANPTQAFTVVKTGGGTQPFTVDLSGSTATQTIAKLNFTGGIADGNYTLTILASQVTDASPFLLGTMAVNATAAFHRLFGDANGDHTVDGTDFGLFGNAFGTTAGSASFAGIFDINGDGTVDGTDFGEFGNRFGLTI
jgi:hypothetical protein